MRETILGFDEAIAAAATGDVWLFRGRSFADRAIQAVTNSPVNHVGMVVALDDLPPLLWHAELGRSLPDVWTGKRQRGVQLHLLADAVRTWGERYGQRAWTRQLEGEIDREHEDRLMEVIERFDGRSFPTTPGLARQWLTGRYRRRESSLETIYCAELVATTYQHMGLLPKRRPGELVRPGPLLERRPDRDGAAVRARRRGRRRSAAGEHDVVAVGAQDLDDRVAVVALELDHAVLGRAADAAALLEPPGERLQLGVAERDAETVVTALPRRPAVSRRTFTRPPAAWRGLRPGRALRRSPSVVE